MNELDNNKIYELSIPIESLSYSDPRLVKYLSFNPIHNYRENLISGLGYKRMEIYDPKRDFIIRTDRTGFRGYDRVYSYYFNGLENEKMNVLEIGAEYSYGALAWARYFQNSNIYTFEHRLDDELFQDERNYIRESFPSEYNRMFIKYNFTSVEENKWKENYGNLQFDIIIDDGKHRSDYQIETFKLGFKYLKSKGFYFIEDVQNTYRGSQLDNNKIYDMLKDLKNKKEIKEISIFRHENIARKKIVAMPNKERKDYFLSRGMPLHLVKFRLERMTDNYINYIIAIQKS